MRLVTKRRGDIALLLRLAGHAWPYRLRWAGLVLTTLINGAFFGSLFLALRLVLDALMGNTAAMTERFAAIGIAAPDPGSALTALAWLLTRPGVTGPIVGPRTQEQLDSALRALQLELSEELLTSLDEIFPGPGPSPEAFAW